jgi:hypothetical protein
VPAREVLAPIDIHIIRIRDLGHARLRGHEHERLLQDHLDGQPGPLPGRIDERQIEHAV